jgi:hypothetical protein
MAPRVHSRTNAPFFIDKRFGSGVGVGVGVGAAEVVGAGVGAAEVVGAAGGVISEATGFGLTTIAASDDSVAGLGDTSAADEGTVSGADGAPASGSGAGFDSNNLSAPSAITPTRIAIAARVKRVRTVA